MVDNSFAHPIGEASTIERPRALNTILYGGLAVGVLDGLYAITFAWLRRGVSPIRVFQYVAGGVLGRDTYNGGLKTFLIGLMFHFLIAFSVATVFYGASLILPTLIRRAITWGLIYGVAVYFVMNYLVVPLSAVPRGSSPTPTLILIRDIIGHALLVGLPVALIARRSARVRQEFFVKR